MGARRRRAEHLAPDVERGGVARTIEALLVGDPGHGAAEVGAGSGKRQETAVLEPDDDEVSLTARYMARIEAGTGDGRRHDLQRIEGGLEIGGRSAGTRRAGGSR